MGAADFGAGAVSEARVGYVLTGGVDAGDGVRDAEEADDEGDEGWFVVMVFSIGAR